MYRIITSGPYSYTGFSEKLAEEFYSAAIKAGLCVLMKKRENGVWSEIKEHIAD